MNEAARPLDRRVMAIACAALLAGGGLGFAWAYTFLGSCLRYGIWELFGCGYTGWAAAAGNAAAAAGCGMLAYLTLTPSGIAERVLRITGMGSSFVATVGALGLPVAPVDQFWRFVVLGWIGIGLWLIGLGVRRATVTQSVLGTILGGTLVVWGLVNIRNEDPLPVVGGPLFFLPFMIWTWRFASRIANGWRPRGVPSRRAWLRVANDIVVALAFVLIVIPAWLVSTFGGPIMGDPIQPFDVRNDTDEVITFFTTRGQPAYGMVVGARQTRSTGQFPRSSYPFSANQGDREIWCHTYTSADLKRAHYVVIVTTDPASCN
ncbi:MAG: hypothetical protein E6J19_00065 [Chloroflexi bacterium]|nr:MAG: hypothetical protein E6J49_01210 [Chloroflexota bacterium]TMC59239.1 MAG: hypothetical protein E6J19_00065 [Chloroflexota bacterium]